MSTYSQIRVTLIDIPNGRLRDVDPDWSACLAGMFTETGHKTPIDVEADGKRFKLVAGAHRLAAAKLLKWKDIDARILEASSEHGADEMRLHEVLENLARRDFNALERCEALFELKRIYEALHPEVKHGGDRKSQSVKARRNDQNEVFSFCFSAAESTGLTARSVQIAVAIFRGLSPETRERLKDTSFADKQSDLKSLSALEAEQQSKVLDLIFGDNPKATSIADALFITQGRKPVSEAEQLFKRVSDM
ncbi:MAG: ParB N-terminal domain-containing protein [Roseibium sp.]